MATKHSIPFSSPLREDTLRMVSALSTMVSFTEADLLRRHYGPELPAITVRAEGQGVTSALFEKETPRESMRGNRYLLYSKMIMSS
jgi:hypothetical protein